MTVEINEPRESLIIEGDVVMTARPVPAPHQAKDCLQCGRPTWKQTNQCVWCGYDRWEAPFRVITVTLLGVIAVVAGYIAA